PVGGMGQGAAHAGGGGSPAAVQGPRAAVGGSGMAGAHGGVAGTPDYPPAPSTTEETAQKEPNRFLTPFLIRRAAGHAAVRPPGKCSSRTNPACTSLAEALR